MNPPYELSGARISFNASGDNTVVANKAGQRIKIFRIRLNVGGATNITIKSGAGTILEVFQLTGAGSSIILDYSDHALWFVAAGQDFIINSSAAVQVEGRVSYVQEA